MMGLPALQLDFRVTAEMGDGKEKDVKHFSEAE